jgi:DNA-binding NtrC family response regulator
MSSHAFTSPTLPHLVQRPDPSSTRYGMVGTGAAMQRLFTQMQRIGPYFRTALITGETGTGKELVARALHTLSPGAEGPFVVCNSSAIVETLFEAELFGHVKGAFTGATTDRMGLFESAHRGTLFLDEIGEMPPATQSKLLRVLQNHEVRRVGSSKARRVEARIVTATNRDLKAMCSTGQFRSDLYYRIAVVELKLPPLRARTEDIALLAAHFTREFAALYGKPIEGITPAALAVLAAHAWPGNIRELENVLGGAAMHSTGEWIQAEDLPRLMAEPGPALEIVPDNLPVRLDDMVKRHVHRVMHGCGGNKLRAADLLGISRSTLYRMLDRD